MDMHTHTHAHAHKVMASFWHSGEEEEAWEGEGDHYPLVRTPTGFSFISTISSASAEDALLKLKGEEIQACVTLSTMWENMK